MIVGKRRRKDDGRLLFSMVAYHAWNQGSILSCYQDVDLKFECDVALRRWIIYFSAHNDMLAADLSL